MKFILLDDDELVYHTPLPAGDIAALQDLLRDNCCLVPSFIGEDAYSVETYVVQYAWSRTETIFLLDRNFYSQVVALAKGKSVTEGTRCAAALMAFASCANTQVEPNLALYEGSASGASRAWKRDLEVFHGADAIHPLNWAELALQRSERFARRIAGKRIRSITSKQFDPSRKLRFYGFIYPLALKMAIISRAGGKADKKMIEFLDWSYYSWYFSAPSISLATMALCQDPLRDIFKGVGSVDRRKALAGVRNAAWDLVYVTAWYDKIKTQSKANNLYVLCSRDKVLLRVADLLRNAILDQSLSPFEEAGFGASVRERYALYESSLSNSKRAMMPLPSDAEAYRAKLVRDLEAEFFRPLSSHEKSQGRMLSIPV